MLFNGMTMDMIRPAYADELETVLPLWLKRKNKAKWYPKYVHFLVVSCPLESPKILFLGCFMPPESKTSIATTLHIPS